MPKRKRTAKKSPKKTKRKASNPPWLEIETTRYYAEMTPEEVEEENRLGLALAAASGEVDFDAD